MAAEPGVLRARARGLAPPELATVVAWAEARRRWGTRGPGGAVTYSFAKVPFWMEPADCLSEGSGVERVVVMKASRVGGTEALVANLVGYAIEGAPGDILLIVPTLVVGQRVVRETLGPMFDATPSLAERLASARPRGAREALLYKQFPGGSLTVLGARSAASLRQTGVRYVLVDDLDAVPPDVGGEGSLVLLAENRARTFGIGRKLLFLSSPVERGRSAIEAEFQRTDQCFFQVPCPACGAFQRLVVEQLRWTPGKPETASYECQTCREPLAEREKPAMLARGRWVPSARGLPRRRGFHISGLYAPREWLAWRDIAAEAERAGADPARARTFRNTILGESVVETIESPAWTTLRDRQRLDVPLGLVPVDGPCYLAGGVDVQRDRLELHVWAVGRHRRRWLVDVQHFEGSTLDDAPWSALRTALDDTWPALDGRWALPLEKVCIDMRFRTPMVLAFARTCPPNLVALVEGMGRTMASGPVIATPRSVETTQADVRHRQRRRRGLQVRAINTLKLKDEFYGCLQLVDPAAPGWITLPACGDEVCRQLTAEVLTRVRVKGVEREQWKTTYANHALDAALYARVAFELARVWDRQLTEAEWTAREGRLGIQRTPVRPAPAAAPPPPDDADDQGDDAGDDAAAADAPPALPRTTAPAPVTWRESNHPFWRDRRWRR